MQRPFPWKNNKGRQSLHGLIDREREGVEMDGRAKEVGRRENKHTVEMERGDGWSGTENGQRKELKCASRLWIKIC